MPDTLIALAPRILSVLPLDDYALSVAFASGETRRVDCRPFLKKGVFRALNDLSEFRQVEVINGGGGVGWTSGADLSRDTLYHVGELIP